MNAMSSTGIFNFKCALAHARVRVCVVVCVLLRFRSFYIIFFHYDIYTMHNKLVISYVSHFCVLIFVQYRTISIAMKRTGSHANKTTSLQTPSFKYTLGRGSMAGGVSKQNHMDVSVVNNAKKMSM